MSILKFLTIIISLVLAIAKVKFIFIILPFTFIGIIISIIGYLNLLHYLKIRKLNYHSNIHYSMEDYISSIFIIPLCSVLGYLVSIFFK